MDAAALATLLSDSTQKLVSLHSQIGHPPGALQGALDALHQALKTAVDDQIGKVQREAQDLSAECSRIEADNAHIKRALGDKSHTSSPSLQNAVGKRMASAASPSAPVSGSAAPTDSQPLLQRRSQLQIEQTRLKASYIAKEAQLDRLSAKLQTYVPLLGTFVKIPPDTSQDSVTIEAAPTSAFRDVSQPRIALFEAEIIRCSKEVNARSERLQTSLLEIVQLWSELNLEPAQPTAPSDDRVFDSEQLGDDIDCGGATRSFDRAILSHLQLEPIHDDETRKFIGEFVSTEQPERRDGGATRSSQAIDDLLSETPTRASLGGQPARNSGDLAMQLSSASKAATPAAPSHILEPSEVNLARAAKKLQWLEAEKHRREMLIQELYDELSELWAKFDVPEEEMDAFVMDHRGSTMDVVEAYQAELEKMKQLKAQHMSLFITKTRERIATLWDSLFLTDEERQASFPPFFIDVSADADPNLDEPLPTDEILASHEQMIDLLTEQVRVKAPVLKVIGRYKELLDEARQLDESASDGSRLLGRSNRGDPGRLLREEKMRKRVKVQKPKIEAELLKVIPAWEEEHGEPFTINGLRYLDELLEQVEGSKENAVRKRTRTVSGAQLTAPPVSAPASVRRGPLGPSASSNRVAATPMRSMTPHQGTIKKPRIAAAPATVAAPSTRTPSVRQGGLPASASRMASARVPMSAAPKAHHGGGAASIQRPASSMAGVYRTASSASYAAGPGSPSRIPGPSPHLAPKPFGAAPSVPGYASAYGVRSVTTASVGLAARTVKAQRESFRPRPSLVAKVPRNANVVGSGALARSGGAVISPGRASKWGEMGPPRWPAAGQPAHAHRDVSCISASSSIHTDITTVIHPTAGGTAPSTRTAEPAKRTRRAPSMSLEACLANLAATSSQGKTRLGEAGRDLGISSIRSVSSSDDIVNQTEDVGDHDSCARVRGWKDGLRIAGAGLEEDLDAAEVMDTDAARTLPRSGSSNWELMGEADSDPAYYSHDAHAAMAA
ncbi:hypothetical protein EX895_003782 [Sporisorium graminicola]|uniref:Uncharacterized protein n=1 Tax=Sporisorium graminicola TaxID=280036 RepID=A0A4U7KRD8_9BASI|nr:hypothetical protein EX895_003782 [Sporisorium graminicola]TKY87105.1 hypothetical protein EX895_003782 [Sporisorium graminicola]